MKSARNSIRNEYHEAITRRNASQHLLRQPDRGQRSQFLPERRQHACHRRRVGQRQELRPARHPRSPRARQIVAGRYLHEWTVSAHTPARETARPLRLSYCHDLPGRRRFLLPCPPHQRTNLREHPRTCQLDEAADPAARRRTHGGARSSPNGLGCLSFRAFRRHGTARRYPRSNDAAAQAAARR